MLSNTIQLLFSEICSQAKAMVDRFVDPKDLTGRIDFVSIYAASDNEYRKYHNELKENGVLFERQITGNYYSLSNPLLTKEGIINRCRVSKYDTNYSELGYVDFEVTDFSLFVEKYVQQKHFSLLENQHGIRLVELKAPGFNVRAYFPDSWV